MPFHSLLFIYPRRFTMLQKMTRTNEKGFTLIELMIVIAIIGVLAAIAIPNFIAYRNKSYCAGAEADANFVAGQLANYFAIPSHTVMPTMANLKAEHLTNNNAPAFGAGSAINGTITINVPDASGRCPTDYQNAFTSATHPKGFWSVASPGTYSKVLVQ
jgi:type IV pilus assembly protein PilA